MRYKDDYPPIEVGAEFDHGKREKPYPWIEGGEPTGKQIMAREQDTRERIGHDVSVDEKRK